MKKIWIYIILLCPVLVGCITEYEHPGIDNLSGILVVEGTITNDTTTIRLSRSIGLTTGEKEFPVVDNAAVIIETESGTVFSIETAPENGCYKIITGDLITGTKYRLKIELEGNTYVSEFLEPMLTPEIESVDLYKKDYREPVQLQVTTQNSEDGSRFYMWSYDEIWEYHSAIVAYVTQEPLLNGDVSRPREYTYHDPYSPYYYCWSYGTSGSLLLGSTVKLSSNRIDKVAIGSFPANSLRFTVLYYVKVKQYSLRKEAYDYFSNLKENAESTGSIFGPIPSEMKGNISCLNDESVPVIGYIEVSENKTHEQFFSSFSNISEHSYNVCPPDITDVEKAEEAGYEWSGLTLYFIDFDGTHLYTLPSCVDCRLSGGSHDRKPYFWPNDHI